MKRLCLLVIPVVAGLAVTGCGSAAQPHVATAIATPTAKTTTAPPDDVVTSYVEAVRGYVRCLRQEGLKVSDPDQRGRFEFEGDLRILKKDPKFVAAQQKCHDLLPEVPDVLLHMGEPTLSPQQIEAAREYAKCMRANGAPDFPDPGPNGYFDDRNADWDATTDSAQRASRKCEPIVNGSLPPGTPVG